MNKPEAEKKQFAKIIRSISESGIPENGYIKLQFQNKTLVYSENMKGRKEAK